MYLGLISILMGEQNDTFFVLSFPDASYHHGCDFLSFLFLHSGLKSQI
jgi:hypothetical protein